MFSDLLGLAIFSFTGQSGIRASHKIRGDPVSSAFLGRLISCSSAQSRAEFESFLAARLGSWQPESQPTQEPRNLISSRMKGVINEKRPVVPSILKDKEEIFCEEEERVRNGAVLIVASFALQGGGILQSF